jgi:hypothetical protein
MLLYNAFQEINGLIAIYRLVLLMKPFQKNGFSWFDKKKCYSVRLTPDVKL